MTLTTSRSCLGDIIRLHRFQMEPLLDALDGAEGCLHAL